MSVILYYVTLRLWFHLKMHDLTSKYFNSPTRTGHIANKQDLTNLTKRSDKQDLINKDDRVLQLT